MTEVSVGDMKDSVEDLHSDIICEENLRDSRKWTRVDRLIPGNSI